MGKGESVVVEHTETWHFETGEKVTNHFVTVHEVRNGKVELWRDYWDLNTLMAQGPKWWIERRDEDTEVLEVVGSGDLDLELAHDALAWPVAESVDLHFRDSAGSAQATPRPG